MAFNTKEFTKTRNKALQSFDILDIADYMFMCAKHSEPTCKHMICAASVCKALLEIPSMDKEVKQRATSWLKKYNFSGFDGEPL